MNRKQELRQKLGAEYHYHRNLSSGALRRLQASPPPEFTEAIAAQLTIGCVRLNAVLYRSYSSLLLGYDIFVKDDPSAEEWIFFDSLPDPVSLRESAMVRFLDSFVASQGLSYTESCFAHLEGKKP